MQSDNDDLITRLARESEEPLAAPHKLKARIYSALIAEQQTTGPLLSLPETKAAGNKLCVFEELVHIAPLGKAAKQPFFCWRCHARVLAERVENAPIWWPHCPYSEFQKT